MRLALLFVLAVAGCTPERGETREWKPSDHDQPAGAAEPQTPAPPMTDAQLATVAWQERCATCHGKVGRGDGPQGPMLGARDLTSDEFLGKTSDAELAAVIRDGKNRMPGFPNLPKRVVDGLIKRIRAKGADAPSSP